jgi:hypothetical protein
MKVPANLVSRVATTVGVILATRAATKVLKTVTGHGANPLAPAVGTGAKHMTQTMRKGPKRMTQRIGRMAQSKRFR